MHQCKNAWIFIYELVAELLVAFGFWNGDVERYEVKTSADCLIDGPQSGLVIADYQEGKLRHELEQVLPHESRRDFDFASG